MVPHIQLKYEVTIRSYGAISTTIRRSLPFRYVRLECDPELLEDLDRSLDRLEVRVAAHENRDLHSVQNLEPCAEM